MAPNELSELTPLTQKLNQESSGINDTLTLVNEKLAALNVGIEVWLGPWKQDRQQHQIGYDKVGDQWQLAFRTCNGEEVMSIYGMPEWVAVEGSYGPSKAVLQSPRSLRITALSLLPAIIKALKTEITQSLEIIEKAKEIAADL